MDPSTDTLYISEGNPGPAQVEVIAAASCNATALSCLTRAEVSLAGFDVQGPVAVAAATHTVYVGDTTNIAVIDARHCNALDLTGCGTQTPATIPVPFGGMAVAQDTLYVTGLQTFDAPGWVNVIDTRHCRAGDTSQCATQADPPKVTVGLFPLAAAVDRVHRTLYVVDNASGQLSLIGTTHCNGDDTSDCDGQTSRAIATPRSPVEATFDPFTSTLYVPDFGNASVSHIDTATCNAAKVFGCAHVAEVVVGSGPSSSALDPGTHTVYVPSFYDGTVSLVATGH